MPLARAAVPTEESPASTLVAPDPLTMIEVSGLLSFTDVPLCGSETVFRTDFLLYLLGTFTRPEKKRRHVNLP